MKYKTHIKIRHILFLILGIIIGLLIGVHIYFGGDFFVKINNIEDYKGNFKMFDDIPKVFYEGINQIIIYKDKPKFWKTYEDFKNQGSIGGKYFDNGVIHIYEANDFDPENYLSHEVGHNIFRNFLNESQRKEWKEIYDKTKKEDFINEYSKTNYEEDFCENIQEYFNYRGFNNRCYLGINTEGCIIDSERLRFIIENVIIPYYPKEIEDLKWNGNLTI